MRKPIRLSKLKVPYRGKRTEPAIRRQRVNAQARVHQNHFWRNSRSFHIFGWEATESSAHCYLTTRKMVQSYAFFLFLSVNQYFTHTIPNWGDRVGLKNYPQWLTKTNEMRSINYITIHMLHIVSRRTIFTSSPI